mmetsp:Transcript_4520/g.10585  ORF Transcript_4520/g.10585 Transcript_4520/m.10585 type:complete len:254 (-) Transcript_4520:30-791(-)
MARCLIVGSVLASLATGIRLAKNSVTPITPECDCASKLYTVDPKQIEWVDRDCHCGELHMVPNPSTLPITAPEKPRACQPTCTWTCSNPVCEQTCQPMCAAPVCKTFCKPLVGSVAANGCKTECQKPECKIICPKSCTSGNCPKCRTVCGPPMCETKCMSDCMTKCADPICNFQCNNPKDCPKPVCSMGCQSTSDCLSGKPNTDVLAAPAGYAPHSEPASAEFASGVGDITKGLNATSDADAAAASPAPAPAA